MLKKISEPQTERQKKKSKIPNQTSKILSVVVKQLKTLLKLL